MKSGNEKHFLCMCQYRCLHVCFLWEGDTWICVFTCVVQMGSCTGGRMFLHIVRTLIDSKWVSARQKRTESKGTLAFVRVSLKYKVLAIKHDESVTLWKPKINPFQTATYASRPKVEILDKDVISNHIHTCQITQLPIFPVTQKPPFTCHYSTPQYYSKPSVNFCFPCIATSF